MSLVLGQLHVRRGDTHALKNLTLSIEPGSKVLVLGPNGAGKTTLLRTVAGLIEPTSGHVQAQGRIGWCSQHECLWPDLTPAEHIEFFSELLGTSASANALKDVDLELKSDALVQTLSGGMRRRLSLALALLNDPEVLLLDEPDAGLDSDGRQQLAALVSTAALSRTVLITTHHPDSLEDVATHVLSLKDGQLACFCTKAEVFEAVPEHFRITCELKNGTESWTSADPQSDLSALLKSLDAAGSKAESIHSERRPLSELVESYSSGAQGTEPVGHSQKPTKVPQKVSFLRSTSALTKVAIRRLRRDPISQALTTATPALFALFFWLALEPREFNQVAPRLGVFAGLMVVFGTAIFAARDLETGVLERLYLARVPKASYLVSTLATQLIPGVMSIALLFAVVLVLGLEKSVETTSFLGLLVNAAACASLGVLSASLAKSVPQAMVLASTLMFLLMLFSGIVFPMPDFEVLNILAPRHAVLGLEQDQTHHLMWSLGIFATYSIASYFVLGAQWKTKRSA